MKNVNSGVVSVAEWCPWDAVVTCAVAVVALAATTPFVDGGAWWGVVGVAVLCGVLGVVHVFEQRSLLLRGDTLIYVSRLAGSTEWRRREVHAVDLASDHPFARRRRYRRTVFDGWLKIPCVVLDRVAEGPVVLPTPWTRREKERIVIALRAWQSGGR